MASVRPTGVRIRSYQVGFGDCFLLTFSYPSFARHILVDFGTMALPPGAGKTHMVRIAEDIRKECGGKLHAIVATHRHQDHISGFTPGKGGKGSGDIIASCTPDVVIQPWTETPDLATTAKAPSKKGPRSLVAGLRDMQAVAESILAELPSARGLSSLQAREIRRELALVGQANLKNAAAVKQLVKMGKRHKYVFYGASAGLETTLPGVAVDVLGPPTLEQSNEIATERRTDSSEFWHLMAAAAPHGPRRNRAALFPSFEVEGNPIYARWTRRRLLALRSESQLELVRILDTALNNTSVILLFRVGNEALLFPGDAQVENWSYCLKQAKHDKDLGRTQVYKVGHHGSLNATPKSLWNLFAARSPARTPHRLRSVMSTMAGVYGSVAAHTEVPRRTLVSALKGETDLATTEALPPGTLYQDVTFTFRSPAKRS